MSRRSLALALLCLLGLSATVWVLERRGAEQPALARLTEVHGSSVERDYSASRERWVNAQPGAEFRLGDGLRTGDKTSGKLHFIDASQLEVQPNTLLRFLPSQDEELGIDVQSGEARLRVSSRDLRVRTHIGSLIVKSGTLVMLSRAGDRLEFQVELGSLQFRDAQGAERSVGAGEQVEVAIGMAVFGASDQPNANGQLDLDVHGSGARMRDNHRLPWRVLLPGAQRVSSGSELSLPEGTSANLTRGADRAELKGKGEYVLGGEDALISTRGGDMSVESVGADVTLEVPGGLIILRKADGGSRAGVRVGPKEGLLSVQRGNVSARLNGREEELTAGQDSSWSTEDAGEEPEGQGDSPSDPSGTVSAPTYFNLAVPAGESFVLHAPEVPVSVAFEVGSKCPDAFEVQVSGSRQTTRGTQRVNVLLNRGTRSYSVRCVGSKSGRVVAKGTINVLLDQGTRKLPPLPPTSLADADGRTYTLYYSNQPPTLKLRWPNAPREPSYTLDVDGKPQTLSAPEYVFKSGELSDGSHAVSFRAGTRRSRTTTIEVRFDNNAPTASVTHPGNRDFTPGQTVEVSGVSLPSWKVSLNGGTIKEESGGRFTGSIIPTPDQPDISVRLSHPRRGVHYYLRRSAASP
ncbi:MAG TPA: hypothetical protein VFZ61_27000 [Polyangiales bacterium]